MVRRMLSMVALAFLAPVALSLMSTAQVSADNGLTIAVGKPSLTSHVLITVPVTITCAPLPADTLAGDIVFVTIQQAHTQTVSTGFGVVEGGPLSMGSGPAFLNCDGSTANVVAVPVLPAQGSSPFRGGPAIVSVNATHAVGSCTPFCQISASESQQFGPSPVKLGG
jgi:hypothetical protein